ncbi:hypothetical protein TYRP_022609 [Tyrophagus putrescentiae]|nr:hypothetical protein TYRP_022598 [Tyrophagus putrescentiae]KAH9391761.1 hypothetical protein TYRP_022609 [Tyrophagus putrescentiae]
MSKIRTQIYKSSTKRAKRHLMVVRVRIRLLIFWAHRQATTRSVEALRMGTWSGAMSDISEVMLAVLCDMKEECSIMEGGFWFSSKLAAEHCASSSSETFDGWPYAETCNS